MLTCRRAKSSLTPSSCQLTSRRRNPRPMASAGSPRSTHASEASPSQKWPAVATSGTVATVRAASGGEALRVRVREQRIAIVGEDEAGGDDGVGRRLELRRVHLARWVQLGQPFGG